MWTDIPARPSRRGSRGADTGRETASAGLAGLPADEQGREPGALGPGLVPLGPSEDGVDIGGIRDVLAAWASTAETVAAGHRHRIPAGQDDGDEMTTGEGELEHTQPVHSMSSGTSEPTRCGCGRRRCAGPADWAEIALISAVAVLAHDAQTMPALAGRDGLQAGAAESAWAGKQLSLC